MSSRPKIGMSPLRKNKTFVSSDLKALVYFLRDNRNIRHQWDILRDYLDFKKNFPFLRENKSTATTRRVIIVSLTPFLYQVKLEALLAKALQLAGCSVSVVTSRHCFWSKKYFRLFGIDSFFNFEDYVVSFRDADVERDCQTLLTQGVGFQQVKGWRFKGCRIGQQVLSTVARMYYGTPDLRRTEMYDQFVKHLRYALRTVYAAEKLLQENRADILLFNEAQGMNYGAFFDLGYHQGVDLIQFVQPLREDALIFKRFTKESYGLHPNSLSKSTFEKVKHLSWTEKEEEALWQEFSHRYGGTWFLSQRNCENTVQKDKGEIVLQLGLAPQKTAVIFSHVLWDANLFYGADIFEDYEDWFVETIKAACRNAQVNWIVKLHPANTWKRRRENVAGELREVTLIREKVGPLPEHVKLLFPETDINTFSLFKLADYGITSRGTIGMELPCFGVPVFTAGTGRYSGLGFTIDSISREDYIQKMERIHEYPALTPAQTLLAKKHAYAVFSLRPCPLTSARTQFRYKKKGIHPLDHNNSLNISSLTALQQAPDLNMFADWVLKSRDTDFLFRPLMPVGREEVYVAEQR